MTIDPARLIRALHLPVKRLPDGWLVNGRLVDPDDGCHCPDRTIRGATCKHELAARLDALDAETLAGLRQLNPQTEEVPQ